MNTVTHSATLRLEMLESRELLAFSPLDAFLEASNPQTDAFYGGVVAISGDYAVVGAGREDSVGEMAGAAYVYTRIGTDWVEQARLVPSDLPAKAQFGAGVAIDGDTILVSAIRDDDQGSESGSVYVYRRDGDTWNLEAKLVAADGAANQWFGSYVDLDGDLAVIGAQRDNTLGSSAGAAYVFQRSGSTWTQMSKLLASDGAKGDLFGSAVAISGTTVLVGAASHDAAGLDAGAAYVFELTSGAWTQVAKLLASDPTAGMNFGLAVDLENGLAVIGAPRDTALGPDAGSAYVFRNVGGTWVQETKLAADQVGFDLFGRSVAIANGDLLVGSPYADEAGLDAGAVYHYRLQGGSWQLIEKYAAENPTAYANFGWHVAVAGDYFLVGAPLASDTVSLSGLAYPAALRLPTFLESPLTVTQGGTGTIGSGNLSTSVPTWASSEIIYTLTSDVQNGVLLLNGVAIGSGSTFTQADIDAGLLVYVHDGGLTTGDSFDFFVSNAAGNLLLVGTFQINVLIPGPDDDDVLPSLSNFVAPFPPELTRPERGLAFDPPIPDDRYQFAPSVGGPSQGRRFLTGDQIILAQAAAAEIEDFLLPGNLPADLFRAAERIFDSMNLPAEERIEAPPAERPDAPRGPDAEPPRLDSSSWSPGASSDAAFAGFDAETIPMLVLESLIQYRGESRLPTALFTDGRSEEQVQALLAATLVMPTALAKVRRKQNAKPDRESENVSR